MFPSRFSLCRPLSVSCVHFSSTCSFSHHNLALLNREGPREDDDEWTGGEFVTQKQFSIHLAAADKKRETEKKRKLEHRGRGWTDDGKSQEENENWISNLFSHFLLVLSILLLLRKKLLFFVTWKHTRHRYHNHRPIEFNTNRGGINLETERTHDGTKSTLLLTRAQFRDGGNYSCVPQGAIPASGYVHVLNSKSLLKLFFFSHVDIAQIPYGSNVPEVLSKVQARRLENWIFTSFSLRMFLTGIERGKIAALSMGVNLFTIQIWPNLCLATRQKKTQFPKSI